jgi:hypothetical protein
MRQLFALADSPRLERSLWALTLLFLPVTSFRFLPFFGDAQVKPLSFIPAVLLFLLILWRCIRCKQILFWNPGLLILLVFMLAAGISSALGALQAPPDLYDYSFTGRTLRAWVTLGVGLIFFIIPAVLVRSEEDLKFTLKWLYIGLAGHLIWSLVQLVEIYITGVIFDLQPAGNLVDTIQKTVMMAGLASNHRISGLALEPSWLAAQMAVFYLPWLFAGLLKAYTFSTQRWVMPALWIVTLGLTILSYSRSGILVVILSSTLALILTGKGLFTRLWRWMMVPFRGAQGNGARLRSDQALRLMLVLVLVAGLAGSVLLLAHNTYFSALWETRASSITEYFVSIYAGPRLAFTWAGWQIYSAHPWFGVGLGATGFYLQAALPDWAHFNASEISLMLSPEYTGFPNTKNFFVRLLAECGVVGFWLMGAFTLWVLGRILGLLRVPGRFSAFVGVAGLFIWSSILLLGFSQDSFAMPLIWLPLGILVGLSEHKA